MLSAINSIIGFVFGNTLKQNFIPMNSYAMTAYMVIHLEKAVLQKSITRKCYAPLANITPSIKGTFANFAGHALAFRKIMRSLAVRQIAVGIGFIEIAIQLYLQYLQDLLD